MHGTEASEKRTSMGKKPELKEPIRPRSKASKQLWKRLNRVISKNKSKITWYQDIHEQKKTVSTKQASTSHKMFFKKFNGGDRDTFSLNPEAATKFQSEIWRDPISPKDELI